MFVAAVPSDFTKLFNCGHCDADFGSRELYGWIIRVNEVEFNCSEVLSNDAVTTC